MKKFDPGEVTLIAIPDDVDTKRLLISANQCQANAYQVTLHYDYTYVEGAAILVGHDNTVRTIAHSWNERKAGISM